MLFDHRTYCRGCQGQLQICLCPEQGPPKAGLSEADAAALEERALKMRKAMGENLSDDVADESPDARTRRLNLIK